MENKIWKLILGGVGVLMFIGFAMIYEDLLKSDIAGLLTLLTIPAVIGALIIGDKYKKQGELFIISSITLFTGFLLGKAAENSKIIEFGLDGVAAVIGGLALSAGAATFVAGLLSLFYVLTQEQ